MRKWICSCLNICTVAFKLPKQPKDTERAPVNYMSWWQRKGKKKRGVTLRLECSDGVFGKKGNTVRTIEHEAGRECESACVCPGSKERNKALHRESQVQGLPKMLGDLSSQQSCQSKCSFNVTKQQTGMNHFQTERLCLCILSNCYPSVLTEADSDIWGPAFWIPTWMRYSNDFSTNFAPVNIKVL